MIPLLRYAGSDGDERSGLFLFYRDTGETRAADLGTSSEIAGCPALSVDGRFVAASTIRGLHEQDDNDRYDVYVRDLDTGAAQWVTHRAQGSAYVGALSADGGIVELFQLWQNSCAVEIYVTDQSGDVLELVSIDGDGNARPASWRAPMSADGRYVAMLLWTDDGKSGSRIFIRDRNTGTSRWVARELSAPYPLAISGDGSYLALTVSENSRTALFILDTQDDQLHEVGVRDIVGDGRYYIEEAWLSHDGAYVAFRLVYTIDTEDGGRCVGVVIRQNWQNGARAVLMSGGKAVDGYDLRMTADAGAILCGAWPDGAPYRLIVAECAGP